MKDSLVHDLHCFQYYSYLYDTYFSTSSPLRKSPLYPPLVVFFIIVFFVFGVFGYSLRDANFLHRNFPRFTPLPLSKRSIVDPDSIEATGPKHHTDKTEKKRQSHHHRHLLRLQEYDIWMKKKTFIISPFFGNNIRLDWMTLMTQTNCPTIAINQTFHKLKPTYLKRNFKISSMYTSMASLWRCKDYKKDSVIIEWEVRTPLLTIPFTAFRSASPRTTKERAIKLLHKLTNDIFLTNE